ncbi:hypothetical protein ACQP2C_14280 [Micromonospora zamorensis]|uniref:hypothetical protein n=1 Tax=Micromonospora zamorensis TaxID=709883 RepID=UPI003D958416
MPRRKAGKRAERPDDRDGVQAGREIMSESAQQRGPDRNAESGDPDVLLVRLAVDGLDADLSLRARVANLLQVDAGVRVHLNGGELDVNGVHAEAQLRVRLEQLTRILGRALDTLDANPQIIEALARTAVTTVDDVNRSAQQLAPGSMGAAEVRGSARRSNGVLQEFGQQVGTVGAVADRAQPGPGRPGPGAGQPGAGRPGPAQPGAGRSEAGPGGPGAVSGRSEAALGGPGAGPGRPEAGPGGAGKGPGGTGPHAGGPGPSAGGPGSQAGGPGSGEKPQPESGGPEGRRPEGRPHEESRQAEGQRHEEPGQPERDRREEPRQVEGQRREESRQPEGKRHEERHHPEGQRAANPGDGKRPAGADRGDEGPTGSSTGERGNRPDQSAGPGPSPSGDRDGGGGLLGGAQSAAQLAEQAGETLRQAGRSVWEAIQSGVAQHRQQGRRDE